MKLIVCLVILPASLAYDLRPQVIFWNTGQGLWVTAVRNNYCFHFDMGGEFYNIRKLNQACLNRHNVAYFSHWDWDHIKFAAALKSSRFCVALLPSSDTKNKKKQFLYNLPQCKKKFTQVDKLKAFFAKTENERSHILIFENKLMLPGDSTKKLEKHWAPLVTPRSIKILAVGHHGSKTSSSMLLLQSVRPSLAIVSARKKVYGHPHRDVIKRFKSLSIPLIKTEDWGNIRIVSYKRLSF